MAHRDTPMAGTSSTSSWVGDVERLPGILVMVQPQLAARADPPETSLTANPLGPQSDSTTSRIRTKVTAVSRTLHPRPYLAQRIEPELGPHDALNDARASRRPVLPRAHLSQ